MKSRKRAFARKLDELIDHLFTNGAGQRAERLVLTVDGPPRLDLGGWGRNGIREAIAAHFAELLLAPPAAAAPPGAQPPQA